MIASVYWAQGQALQIEARTKIRLAGEYDAAQARGENGKHGGSRQVSNDETYSGNDAMPPKQIHRAHQFVPLNRLAPAWSTETVR